MKNLLTIVVSCACGITHESTLYDGIELIFPNEGEQEKSFVLRAIKSARGKYTVLLERKFKFADINPLLNILDKNSSDMVLFTGGTAIKTSIIKGVAKDCNDLFSCFILSVLDCKTVLKSNYTPFIYSKCEIGFTEDNYSGILVSAQAFGKEKSKLSKEVYTHAMGALCARLECFYLAAMIAIRDGKIKRGDLLSFDSKLKSEIVLFLALEKNFTAAKLSKLRKKEFKISGLTAKKFKKKLKT